MLDLTRTSFWTIKISFKQVSFETIRTSLVKFIWHGKCVKSVWISDITQVSEIHTSSDFSQIFGFQTVRFSDMYVQNVP